MSVEKMRLINVLGRLDDFSKAADIIYNSESFHAQNTKEFLGKFETIMPFDSKNPNDRALSIALEALNLSGYEAVKADFEGDKSTIKQREAYFAEVRDTLNAIAQKNDERRARISKNEYAIGFLQPLADFDIPFSKLMSFEYISVRLGKMPQSSSEKYKVFINENEDVFFFPFKEDKEFVYGMYIAPKQLEEKTDAVFASLSFEQLPSAGDFTSTPKETIELLTNENEQINAEIATADEEAKSYFEAQKDTLMRLYSKTRHDFEVYRLMCNAAHSESTFYLIGWVPERDAEGFIRSFDEFDTLMCRDVTDKDEEVERTPQMPPTKLRNFVLFRPFEMFLKMYALPSYNEMDPTPLLAIAYSILFGVMFGDVGQGLVLLIGGLILGIKKKMALGKIVATVSVFSIIFGFVYGSFFGYEDIIPGYFHAMEHINFTLVASVILGMFMVVFMMVLNIVNGIRQKNFQKVVFSSNGFAGLLLYVGIIAIMMVLFNIGKNIFSPIFIVVCFVLPLVLIWLREPLSHICLRKKWQPKDKGLYFLENFFELIDVFLSALTNTISFIRVGAFALNHVGMMMVVFILAQSANGGHNIVAVIIGNLIVIALEGLLVGIQVLRLNYYEFFSRFFDGNGREFEPAKINYNKNNI